MAELWSAPPGSALFTVELLWQKFRKKLLKSVDGNLMTVYADYLSPRRSLPTLIAEFFSKPGKFQPASKLILNCARPPIKN